MLQRLHEINNLPFNNLTALEANNCLRILSFKVKACTQLWHQQLGLDCSIVEFKGQLKTWFGYLQDVAHGN